MSSARMIRTVLSPVDFSPISERELRLASQLCERLDGARLVIHHSLPAALPPGLGVSWMHAEEHRSEDEARAIDAQKEIRTMLAKIPASVKAEGKLTYGAAEAAILGVAGALAADLIVIGTHGRSGGARHSATEQLILDAPCPTLATRDHSPEASFPECAGGGLDTIRTLVPVDFSSHSERALDYALALSKELPMKLHVLHVDPLGAEDHGAALDRLQHRVPAEDHRRVVLEVRRGLTIGEILRREVDLEARLIIMGTHHKNLIRQFLGGSTAREVLHGSFCPVLFVPERAAMRIKAA